ncbi:MAG: hypothetical protein WCL18_04075 [bacterium]
MYSSNMEIYLKADNNQIETLGTGQASSIIQKGASSRQTILFDSLLGNGIIIIASIAIAFVIIIIKL